MGASGYTAPVREVEVSDAVLRELPLPAIGDGADKHRRGTVLVVGGTVETPGAAILAGVAALRVGAGRLRIAIAGEVAAAVAVAVPEARVIGLPAPLEEAAAADAVLVGSGWSAPDDAAVAAVARARGTVVVDAGALRAAPALVGALGRRAVLLPNEREAAELGDCGRAVVSCRGAVTRTVAPGGPVYVDRAGSVGLATSGSGDVAAGMVAGLAARGADPLAAAVWGARLHRRAGERLGGTGFLARELLLTIRDVLPAVDYGASYTRAQ